MVPCATVDEALAARDRFGPGGCVLGGERGGLRIEGFDLGNSPLEYTPLSVLGRAVIFTTTNGTAAVRRATDAAAGTVLIGCLANAAAVVRSLAQEDRAIHLLCAGTRGDATLEDALTAGALAEMLVLAGHTWADDDQGRLVAAAWRDASASADRLHRAMRDARGGRELLRLGFDADVEFCSRVSVWDTVPILRAAPDAARGGLGVDAFTPRAVSTPGTPRHAPAHAGTGQLGP